MKIDRIGTVILIGTTTYLVALPMIVQANSRSFHNMMIAAAVVMIAIAILPADSYALNTIAMFSVLGLALGVGVWGILSVGWPGLIPGILAVIAMWCRRDRLDANWQIPGIIACGVSIFALPLVITAWITFFLISAAMWGVNRVLSRVPDPA